MKLLGTYSFNTSREKGKPSELLMRQPRQRDTAGEAAADSPTKAEHTARRPVTDTAGQLAHGEEQV